MQSHLHPSKRSTIEGQSQLQKFGKGAPKDPDGRSDVCNQGIHWTTNHVSKPSTDPSVQASGTRAKNQESYATARTLPKTCLCVQWTRSPEVPRTMTMGSHNRTQKGRPCHTTRKNICTHTRWTKSAPRVHQRTRSKGIYTPIQKSLCRTFLFHQKKGQTIATSPRLQTTERMDNTQPISPPSHQRTHLTRSRSVLRLTAYYAQRWVLCKTRTRVLKAVDDDGEMEGNGGSVRHNEQ